MTALRPYAVMKESNEGLLGEVPAHWDVCKLGQVGVFLKGNGGNKGDEASMGVPCIRYGDLYTTHRFFVSNSRSFVSKRKSLEYTSIKFGDVLFAGSGETIEEIGKSAVNLIKSDAVCGGDIVILRPRCKVLARYMGYVLECHPVAAQKSLMGRGITVIHIYGNQLKYVAIPFPSLIEQTSIVRFLDHTDQLSKWKIRAKQKLLHLLEEQKQAIIQQAVTGQIDVRTGKPYLTYKPSRAKWLGDLPEHWEVRRLRNVADMRVSNVDKHVKDGENPVRLCNYVDVYNNDYIDKRMVFMHATATNEEIERFRLERDDVLITKDSEAWDDIGVPALVTEPACDLISGYHLALLRPLPEKLAGAYLLRALQSKGLAHQFYVEAKGVTRYGLSHAGITSVWLPLPSLPEQIAIVQYLDEISANIETAITHTRRQIELFQEYRTRLISDVVTGKLDVCEAASNLPNNTELMDTMDSLPEAVSVSERVGQVAG